MQDFCSPFVPRLNTPVPFTNFTQESIVALSSSGGGLRESVLDSLSLGRFLFLKAGRVSGGRGAGLRRAGRATECRLGVADRESHERLRRLQRDFSDKFSVLEKEHSPSSIIARCPVSIELAKRYTGIFVVSGNDLVLHTKSIRLPFQPPS